MIKVFKKGLCKSKLKRKRKGTVLLLFIGSGNMLGIWISKAMTFFLIKKSRLSLGT